MNDDIYRHLFPKLKETQSQKHDVPKVYRIRARDFSLDATLSILRKNTIGQEETCYTVARERPDRVAGFTSWQKLSAETIPYLADRAPYYPCSKA